MDIDKENIDMSKAILRADKGMGNGKITDIQDLIYVDPRHFDRLRTEQMAEEVKFFNEKLKATDTPYILIGPGRWGTRDKLTGIPVLWSDISKARIIVEQGLRDFPLDASGVPFLSQCDFHECRILCRTLRIGQLLHQLRHYSKSAIDRRKRIRPPRPVCQTRNGLYGWQKTDFCNRRIALPVKREPDR